jgi:hypothetical protein
MLADYKKKIFVNLIRDLFQLFLLLYNSSGKVCVFHSKLFLKLSLGRSQKYFRPARLTLKPEEI